MSTTKTKEELVRMAWTTALRLQGHRQCHGTGEYLGKVCAVALLGDIVEAPDCQSLIQVAAEAGLSEMQAWTVIACNDGRPYHYVGSRLEAIYCDRKHTFAEIADVVEGWFAKEPV